MKKTFISVLMFVFVFGFFVHPVQAQAAGESTAYLEAKTAIESITSKSELKALIKFLKKQIKVLKKENKSSSSSVPKENLTISSVTVAYPEIGGATEGVMDQKISVVVKNNEFGSPTLSYEKFKYAIILYEIVDGDKEKIKKVATGEAYVPYANGYSSFDAYIEGGEPYDGDNFERTFVAEVEIDTSNKIKESNEKDNKGWSDDWLYTYYKG
jgi:hypothetical protein